MLSGPHGGCQGDARCCRVVASEVPRWHTTDPSLSCFQNITGVGMVSRLGSNHKLQHKIGIKIDSNCQLVIVLVQFFQLKVR